jgi:enoyl-CoA hydratase
VVHSEEALAWGLVNEVVPEGRDLERALEIAEGLAGFPQTTMLSDRRAALEGAGLQLADGLAREGELGLGSIETGIRGATRFAAGEGRGAEGAGV